MSKMNSDWLTDRSQERQLTQFSANCFLKTSTKDNRLLFTRNRFSFVFGQQSAEFNCFCNVQRTP